VLSRDPNEITTLADAIPKIFGLIAIAFCCCCSCLCLLAMTVRRRRRLRRATTVVDGTGRTPQERALMAAAAESLESAKTILLEGRETIETQDLMSTEQLAAAQKQLGGRQMQRKAATVAANEQLEAATAQLAQAEVEFAAAATVRTP